jgi:tRNA U55 pseudouridine synthase TruB
MTDLSTRILPAATLVSHLPSATITENQTVAFGQGKHIPLLPEQPAAEQVAVFDPKENLIGIGAVDKEGQLLPKKVLSGT